MKNTMNYLYERKRLNVLRAYGLTEFARVTETRLDPLTLEAVPIATDRVWAKDLTEAQRIADGHQAPYDALACSNELYRNGKITAASAL